ncbi:hypothetical protein BOX15_Mlig026909g2, partial [Macrostomum lignano]
HLKMAPLLLLAFCFLPLLVDGSSESFFLEDFADTRCKCVCPRGFPAAPTAAAPTAAAAVKDSAAATQPQKRRVWVAQVRPGEKCGCEATVTASAASASAASAAAQLAEYCRRCKCQAESRNSAVQKVVIISLLLTIGCLCLYMLLLFLLWSSRGARDQTGRTCRAWLSDIYQLICCRHPDGVVGAEDEQAFPREDADTGHSDEGASVGDWSGVRIRTASDAVVTRARAKQAEWSKSVAAQRDRVYRHRSMLQ